jgi:GAF domain
LGELCSKAAHIPDVLADPEYALIELQKLGHFRSVLAVPLLREGNPIGAIFLSRQSVRPFTSKQIDLASSSWGPNAMAGRHLAKYIEPVQPGFVAAVRAIFNAYEDHPNGEKEFPPIPVNFGN